MEEEIEEEIEEEGDESNSHSNRLYCEEGKDPCFFLRQLLEEVAVRPPL